MWIDLILVCPYWSSVNREKRIITIYDNTGKGYLPSGLNSFAANINHNIIGNPVKHTISQDLCTDLSVGRSSRRKHNERDGRQSDNICSLAYFKLLEL